MLFRPSGKFRGHPVLYRDHRKGPGGPPGGATYPGGPRGLNWEGNQPLVGWCAPPWAPPAPRVGNPRVGGAPLALGGWCPWPIKVRAPPTSHAAVLDVVEHFPDLRTPPESSGTFRTLPGTIPKKPELFPEPEQQLSIYKSLPPNHSGTPPDVRDLIRDSEQLSGFRILISLQP